MQSIVIHRLLLAYRKSCSSSSRADSAFKSSASGLLSSSPEHLSYLDILVTKSLARESPDCSPLPFSASAMMQLCSSLTLMAEIWSVCRNGRTSSFSKLMLMKLCSLLAFVLKQTMFATFNNPQTEAVRKGATPKKLFCSQVNKGRNPVQSLSDILLNWHLLRTLTIVLYTLMRK